MKKKNMLVMLCGITIIAAVVLAGCGNKAKEDDTASKKTQEEEDSKEETKQITFYTVDCDSELECHDYWDGLITEIQEKYSTDDKGQIMFYGASNFARWTTMEADMSAYKVQNHAFGGSTDVELVGYAQRVLFPYEPSVVFFQTGSNDYVQLSGTDEEKISKCMDYKRAMFSDFHEKMPNAKFVIMSGLLLPGRAEYVEMTKEINRQLEAYANEEDYLYYIDANDMTYDGTNFKNELFVEDLIHLNHEGQMLWYNNYIQPMIEKLITENGLESVRK